MGGHRLRHLPNGMVVGPVALVMLLDGGGIEIEMDGTGIVQGQKERQTRGGVMLIRYFMGFVEQFMVLINSGHRVALGVPREHIHERLTECGIKNEIGEVVIYGHGIVLEKMEELRLLVSLCIDV